jgi:hypothetical protein
VPDCSNCKTGARLLTARSNIDWYHLHTAVGLLPSNFFYNDGKASEAKQESGLRGITRIIS